MVIFHSFLYVYQRVVDMCLMENDEMLPAIHQGFFVSMVLEYSPR